MKNKKALSTILLFMTIILLGATVYISTLLQNDDDSSITQIKKTKASAQTYHKTVDFEEDSESSAQSSSSLIAQIQPSANQLAPSLQAVNPTLKTSLTSISPTIQISAPTTSSLSSISSFSSISSSQLSVSVPSAQPTKVVTSIPIPTIILSSSSSSTSVLAYNNPSPTSKPVGLQNNTQILATPTTKPFPTTIQTASSYSSSSSVRSVISSLPQTGIMQYLSLFGIAALGLIFFAFIL